MKKTLFDELDELIGKGAEILYFASDLSTREFTTNKLNKLHSIYCAWISDITLFLKHNKFEEFMLFTIGIGIPHEPIYFEYNPNEQFGIGRTLNLVEASKFISDVERDINNKMLVLTKFKTEQIEKNHQRSLWRDQSGEFFSLGKHLKISRKSIYYIILDFLFNKTVPRASYAEIEQQLIENGVPKSKDARLYSKKIRNALLNNSFNREQVLSNALPRLQVVHKIGVELKM